MSRSSEIRSQRWKAERARRQTIQAMQRAEEEEEDDQGFYYGGIKSYQQEGEDTAAMRNPENVLLLNDHNEHFNMTPLLLTAIRNTLYFKSKCSKISNFNEMVDRIYLDVKHLDPFEHAPSASMSSSLANRPASSAFCLLVRCMEMKLTKNQMQTMIAHQDSPFIRCVAMLYLRYLGKFDELFDSFEPLLSDHESFAPDRDAPNKTKTVAQYAKELLTTMRYKDTLFPRIPVPIEKQIQAKLTARANSSTTTGTHVDDPLHSVRIPPGTSLTAGTICRAKYSEDEEWYDVRVEEPGSKPDTYWVTYLPEEEYGNQEEVSLNDMQFLDHQSKSQNQQESNGNGGEGGSSSSENPRQEEANEGATKRARLEATTTFGETDENGLTKYDDL